MLLIFFSLAVSQHQTDGESKRSERRVEIQGKSFYLHTVKPQETLSSLSRLYEVPVADILQQNRKTDPALSVGEVLQIPYVAPYRPVDDHYYYHKMRARETLYSLSRKFDIRIKRILKENPDLTVNTPLPIGAVVRLPLKLINRNVLEGELLWLEREARGALTTTETDPDNETAQENTQEGLESSESAYASTDRRHLRVSVLLPFGLSASRLPQEGELRIDSLGRLVDDERGRLDVQTEGFRHFFHGLMLAADSLKRMGYMLEFQLLETRRDTLRLNQLMGELVPFAPHLIIGPVYQQEYRYIAERMQNRGVPMIYPMLSGVDQLGHLSSFIQINTSMESMTEEMASWFLRRYPDAHWLTIQPPVGQRRGEEARLPEVIATRLRQEGKELPGTFQWNNDKDRLQHLEEQLSREKNNLIIFPSINEADANRVLPELSTLARDYRITLVGFPEWLRFTALDEELFFQLNVTLFQNTQVNWESGQGIRFAESYRQAFYAEPTRMSARGYDIGLFFIPLVDQYRHRVWEQLTECDRTGVFTRFRFRTVPGFPGMENRGLFMVRYGSDFEIHTEVVSGF